MDSLTKLFSSRLSAELSSLKVFVHFPHCATVPLCQHAADNTHQLAIRQGEEVEFYQNHMNYFICFDAQRFFTVQAVAGRRY